MERQDKENKGSTGKRREWKKEAEKDKGLRKE